MCTLFVWYFAITFVTVTTHFWKYNIIVCVRICNSTWRTIYTYNNKYHSPKSNITTLHSVDCWIIYYLFSAAYPKWEYASNYMTLKILSLSWHDMHNNMLSWHDITHTISWHDIIYDIMAWHHIAYDIMAWHHIYTDIITPFGNKVAPVLLQNSARQPQGNK